MWCSSDMDIVNIDRKYIAYLSVLISIILSIYTSWVFRISNDYASVHIKNKLNLIYFRLKTTSKSRMIGVKVNKSEVFISVKLLHFIFIYVKLKLFALYL